MSARVAVLHNDAEYEAAVQMVERLWGAPQGTEDGDTLDVLLVLINAYESEHHAIEAPDPIDAITDRMETLGLNRDDLGRMLGSHSGRVSEILNRRRALTLGMIRTLTKELGLSEHCLVQDYELSRAYA